MRSDGLNGWPEAFAPVILLPLPGPVSAALGFAIALAPIIAPLLTHQSTEYQIRTTVGAVMWSTSGAGLLLAAVVPIGAISTLQSGQVYYLRARFTTSAGVTPWSEECRITT